MNGLSTSGTTGLEELIKLMQFSDRFVKVAGEQQKHAELAQLHRAIENSTRSDKNRNDDTEGAD